MLNRVMVGFAFFLSCCASLQASLSHQEYVGNYHIKDLPCRHNDNHGYDAIIKDYKENPEKIFSNPYAKVQLDLQFTFLELKEDKTYDYGWDDKLSQSFLKFFGPVDENKVLKKGSYDHGTWEVEEDGSISLKSETDVRFEKIIEKIEITERSEDGFRVTLTRRRKVQVPAKLEKY